MKTSESELKTFSTFVTEDKSKLQLSMRKHPNFEEFPNNLHIEGMEINSIQLSHKALGILFAVRVWRGGSETVGLTDGV